MSGWSQWVFGQAEVNLSLMGNHFWAEVLVVKSLTMEAILGLNFLQQYGALIDLWSKLILIEGDHGIHVPLQRPPKPESKSFIRVEETIRIPPCSKLLVMAEMLDSTDGVTYLVEMSRGIRLPVLVVRTLVEPKVGKVPPKLFNPREEPTTLKAGRVPFWCLLTPTNGLNRKCDNNNFLDCRETILEASRGEWNTAYWCGKRAVFHPVTAVCGCFCYI